MIGTISALLISYWYYKNALKKGKNAVLHAALGFGFYLIPALLWTIFVTPHLRDAVSHSPGQIIRVNMSFRHLIEHSER
jgi:hypothetical protein